jgi:predicted alpha/beta-fold hydrolase
MEVIYCAKFEKRPFVKVKEEKIIFKDGDTTFLGTIRSPKDWADVNGSTVGYDSPDNKIAVVLGAVNGANYCNYTTQIMQQLQTDGFRVVLVHYRNFKIHQPPEEKDPKVRCADPAQLFRELLFDRRP